MPYNDYDPDDQDAPQPADVDAANEDDEADDDVRLCAGCGRKIHAMAAMCPHCGEWVLEDSPARQRSRGWFWPLMVALLIAIILVFWAGLR